MFYFSFPRKGSKGFRKGKCKGSRTGIWLQAWCDARKVTLIATRFEIANENFTGKIAGPNMKGDAKYEVVKRLLNEHRPAHTFGYGNSKADKAFLSLLERSFNMPLNTKSYIRWKDKISSLPEH